MMHYKGGHTNILMFFTFSESRGNYLVIRELRLNFF